MTLLGQISQSVLRSLARRVLYPAIESTWAVLFHLAHLLLRPTAAEVSFSGSDRVLVISPHPDDETLGCGGTIVRHVEAGDQVQVLIVTDGGASRARGLTRPEMSKRRAEEARLALALLHPEVQLTLGRLPEGRWEAHALDDLLTQQITRLHPTIIYAPSCIDFHPEHLKVSRCLAQFLAREVIEPGVLVRVYELQVPLSVHFVNRQVNIKQGLSRKKAALSAYRTQQRAFAWRSRQELYLKAMFNSANPIEVFSEMAMHDYVKLMAPTQNNPGPYRSFRPRPFTDGLAWVIGTSSRQKLRDQLME